MNKLLKRLLVGVVLGVGVYAGFAIYLGLDKLWAELTTFSLWLFIPVLALTFTNYLLRYAKWTLYLRCLGIRVPAGINLVIFLGGLSMTVTPGKIGELLKSYLVRESQGIEMARTVPVVMAERITDLLALVLLIATGMSTFRLGLVPMIVTGAAIAAFVVVVNVRSLCMGIIGLLTRLPVLGRVGHKLEQLYDSTATLFRVAPLLASTALSVGAWFCECLGFYLVLGGFPDTNPSVLLATVIYSSMTLGGVVSPGGLGVTDGGMALLLNRTAAFSPARSGAATLIIRLCTLWFAVLVGVVALLVFRKRVGLSDDAVDQLRQKPAATPNK